MKVYWSVFQPRRQKDFVSFAAYFDPVPVWNDIANTVPSGHEYLVCPAARNQFHNVFALKFPFDYQLSFDFQNEQVNSSMYDQDFFSEFVWLRTPGKITYSLNIHYIFFCEQELELELTSAYWSENTFVNNTLIMPGRYDIGSWFRPLDCAFKLKQNVDNLIINRGDDFEYVKFNTKEKVELVKFHVNENLENLIYSIHKSRSYKRKKYMPLSYWYDMYTESKTKNLIKREILANIL